MTMAEKGMTEADVLAQLQELKTDDLDWQSGRAFGYVFDGGSAVKDVARKAASMFLFENGLDPTVFRSLLRMETDLVSICRDLVRGGDKAVGSATSGGTESIILAVKAARNWARLAKPEISSPEMVLPDTAHAAFHKAAHYLGVRTVVVPSQAETFQADIPAMQAAITPNTILLVGSAPSYAHGVIDNIPALGELALDRDLWLHVDACMGGVLLPYLRRLGEDIAPFDFTVPGVRSLSMDLHKYGYAAKGISIVLYRDAALRRHQIYACAEWTGYTMVNTTVQSTKSGAPLAAAWAVMSFLGDEGYLTLAKAVREATQQIVAGIRTTGDLKILGNPAMSLVAFTSEQANVFHLVDEMNEQGWYVQPQFARNHSPANIHLTVTAAHLPHTKAFSTDLSGAFDRASALPPGQLAASLRDALPQFAATAPTPETYSQMLALAGVNGSALPGRMAEINEVLNLLPPRLSEGVLTEFFNRLYQ